MLSLCFLTKLISLDDDSVEFQDNMMDFMHTRQRDKAVKVTSFQEGRITTTCFRDTRRKTKESFQGYLKCWGYEEPHLLRNFPHRSENVKNIHNVQEAPTVNDVVKSITKIYGALEDRTDNV